MGKLNSNFLILGMCEIDNCFEAERSVDVGIEPYSAVFGGDSTVCLNGGGFDYAEAGAAGDYSAEVGEVPGG
jgi:hypothetical protein